MRIIAKTFHGLEEVLSKEIEKIGASEITILNRAVKYQGDLEVLYRSNIQLRTALRILVPISEFKAYNEEELYKGIQNIYWWKYLNKNGTFCIDSVVNSEIFTHSKYAALKSKDAIADLFREKYGERPSVDLETPDIKINLHIRDHKVTVSLDASGESLHKRGYRISVGKAPINEVLAAGLIQLSGWDGKTDFVDPMCGSGTLAIEAANYAMNKIPQNPERNFNFLRWKKADKGLWERILEEQIALEKPLACKIIAADKDRKSIRDAEYNIAEAGLSNHVEVNHSDFFETENEISPLTLVFNPPYDERLKEEDIEDFYKQIGDKFKQSYKGCSAWIFSANLDALKKIGLKTSRKITLYNGPLLSKFHRFDMYAGSKKKKNN